MWEEVILVGGEDFDGVTQGGDRGEEGGKIPAGAATDEDVAFIGGGGELDEFPGVDFEGNVTEAFGR